LRHAIVSSYRGSHCPECETEGCFHSNKQETGKLFRKAKADGVAALKVLRRRGAEPEGIMGQVHPKGRCIQSQTSPEVGPSRGQKNQENKELQEAKG